MNLDFIPRAQLVTRLNEGWRLVADHEYLPADYAILMCKPEEVEAVDIQAIVKAFEPKPPRPRICIEEGCEVRVHAHGRCNRHALQHRRRAFLARKLAEMSA